MGQDQDAFNACAVTIAAGIALHTAELRCP